MMRQRAEAALAANPNDAHALCELAEMHRVDGKVAEAVALLKSADDWLRRTRSFTRCLPSHYWRRWPRTFPRFEADLPLVQTLVQGRDQEIELIASPQGARPTGRSGCRAWDAYLRLADFTAESPDRASISAPNSRSQRSLGLRPIGRHFGRQHRPSSARWHAELELRRARPDRRARRPSASPLPGPISDELPGSRRSTPAVGHVDGGSPTLSRAQSRKLNCSTLVVSPIRSCEPSRPPCSSIQMTTKKLRPKMRRLSWAADWPTKGRFALLDGHDRTTMGGAGSRQEFPEIGDQQRQQLAQRPRSDSKRSRDRNREGTDNNVVAFHKTVKPGLRRLRSNRSFGRGCERSQWFVAADG